jgi:hypothetical protein
MNVRHVLTDRRTPYSEEALFLMRVPRAGAILYKLDFAARGQRERSMKRLGIRGPEMVVPFVPTPFVPVAPVTEAKVTPVRPRRCPPAPKKAKSKSQPELQSLPVRRRAPVAAARKTLFEAPQAGFVVDGANPFLLVAVVPEVVAAQPESTDINVEILETVNPTNEIPEIVITPAEDSEVVVAETVIPCPHLLSACSFEIAQAAPVVKANPLVCPQAPRRKQIKPIQQRLKKDDRVTKRLFGMAGSATTTTGEGSDSTNPFA